MDWITFTFALSNVNIFKRQNSAAIQVVTADTLWVKLELKLESGKLCIMGDIFFFDLMKIDWLQSKIQPVKC